MQVPMPFVPSTSSDHTAPSQVPQYRNWLAQASSARCATAVSDEIRIAEHPITAPGSRWTGFWRRRAVEFPTVAKRAVAANGVAVPRGTADALKKALSKRHQATPGGGTPAIAAGAN